MGRLTVSAAITSIAYLKQAGKERVVLAGEPPGDRLMFFSDGRPIQLPHTGLFFRPSPVRQDYQTACIHYTDCFVGIAQPGSPWAPPTIVIPKEGMVVERRPLAVKSLDPDIPAPPTIDSMLNGTDPAMAAIADEIGRGH
jgi:hypothetical protein